MEQLRRTIGKEWNMFAAVNEDREKASCQQDPNTFFAMRQAQLSAWSEELRLSYEQDLDEAARSGRNLMEEKYIRMMAVTEPQRYLLLADRLPAISEQKAAAADRINRALLRQTAVMRKAYPFLSQIGRPLYAAEAGSDETAIETYQLGELLTYSERTLALLQAYILELEQQGVFLAERIQLNSLRCAGISSFEEAAARLEEQSRSAMGSAAGESCRSCSG